MSKNYFLTHLQFSELEDLGYKGFAIAFQGAKSQLVGTPSTLKSFSPQLLEYLHAVVVSAGPPPSLKSGKYSRHSHIQTSHIGML